MISDILPLVAHSLAVLNPGQLESLNVELFNEVQRWSRCTLGMPILVPAVPMVSRLMYLQLASIPDAILVPQYPADAFDTLLDSPR